jgi:hypothetical protein
MPVSNRICARRSCKPNSHPYAGAVRPCGCIKQGGRGRPQRPRRDRSAANTPRSAARYHAEGIFKAEKIFESIITSSTRRVISVRWIDQQHLREDLGFIPSFPDWVKAIRPEPCIGRSEKIEAELDQARRSKTIVDNAS